MTIEERLEALYPKAADACRHCKVDGNFEQVLITKTSLSSVIDDDWKAQWDEPVIFAVHGRGMEVDGESTRVHVPCKALELWQEFFRELEAELPA